MHIRPWASSSGGTERVQAISSWEKQFTQHLWGAQKCDRDVSSSSSSAGYCRFSYVCLCADNSKASRFVCFAKGRLYLWGCVKYFWIPSISGFQRKKKKKKKSLLAAVITSRVSDNHSCLFHTSLSLFVRVRLRRLKTAAVSSLNSPLRMWF